jgi:hypothetical protein
VPSSTTEDLATTQPSHPHSNTPFRQKDIFTMEKGSSNTVTVPPADVDEIPQNNPTLRPRAKSISGSRKPRRSISNPPSPLKVNGVVQLELTDSMEQQIRDEKDLSYETHSDVSADGDNVILEGTDDGEEEEDEEDEGDSDVEFDEEVLKKIYSTTEWSHPPQASSSTYAKGTHVAHLFDHEGEEEEEEGKEDGLSSPVGENDGNDDDQSFPPPPEKNASMAGLGLSGEEGKALRALINPRQDLTQMSRDAEKELNTEKRLTFGPGAAQYHPWSSRVDAGINSRLANEKRGDDIYFIGIIDILQQYNASKRFETFFKVHHLLLTSFSSLSLSLFVFHRASLTTAHKSVQWILFLMQSDLLLS